MFAVRFKRKVFPLKSEAQMTDMEKQGYAEEKIDTMCLIFSRMWNTLAFN